MSRLEHVSAALGEVLPPIRDALVRLYDVAADDRVDRLRLELAETQDALASVAARLEVCQARYDALASREGDGR